MIDATSELGGNHGNSTRLSVPRHKLVVLAVVAWAFLAAGMPGSAAAETRDPALWPFATSSLWNVPISREAIYRDIDHTAIENGAVFRIATDDVLTLLDPTAPLAWIHQYRDKPGPWRGRDRVEARLDPVHYTRDRRLFQAHVSRGFRHVSRGNDIAVFVWSDGLGQNWPARADRSTFDWRGSPPPGSFFEAQPLTVRDDGTAALRSDGAVIWNNLFVGDGRGGAQGGSSLSALGGLIRTHEFLPEAHPVVDGIQTGARHALKITLPSTYYLWFDPRGKAAPGFRPTRTQSGYRWPAQTHDRNAHARYNRDGQGNWTGTAQRFQTMGVLYAIPSDTWLARNDPDYDSLAEIQADLATTPGKMFAWTLQTFGAYQTEGNSATGRQRSTELVRVVTETNSATGKSFHVNFARAWSKVYGVPIRFKHSPPRRDAGPFAEDWFKLLRLLRVVDSNDALNVGGGPIGSARLAPLAPPFDGRLVPASIKSQLRAGRDYK